MTETFPRLLALQVCDQRIQQMIHALDAFRQSLTTLKEEEQAKAQEIRAWQDKIREGEKASDHLTPQIEHVKGQLRKQRGALHRCRAGRQEEAVQGEIVLLEASKVALEEELCTVAAQIAQDMEALRQAEAMAAAHQEEAARTASTILGQSATVEEELRAAQDERTALATGISAFLLQEYERIFSRRGGVAVVALANETCQGCHMHLPPQMCLELQRRPKLTFCPHCQRILFTPGMEGRPLASPQPPWDDSNGHRTRQPPQQIRNKAHTGEEPREGAVFPPPRPAHA